MLFTNRKKIVRKASDEPLVPFDYLKVFGFPLTDKGVDISGNGVIFQFGPLHNYTGKFLDQTFKI